MSLWQEHKKIESGFRQKSTGGHRQVPDRLVFENVTLIVSRISNQRCELTYDEGKKPKFTMHLIMCAWDTFAETRICQLLYQIFGTVNHGNSPTQERPVH